MDATQLVRNIFEMIDSGDYGRAKELIHEDFVDHGNRWGKCAVARASWRSLSSSGAP